MQRHLVFLELLKLLVSLTLKRLFLFLQLRDRTFQILCEQLQLMLDRDVLTNVTFVLLELGFERSTVLMRVHAHV